MNEPQPSTPVPRLFARIVSGGQSGADRAALDWAIRRGVSHGGWCPRGRLAEDGPISPRYRLRETPDAEYDQRTLWNVRDSDATVIFSLVPGLTGGSALTFELANRLGNPVLHLHAGMEDPVSTLREFLLRHSVLTLNVAGPRESTEPGIGSFVATVLDEATHGPGSSDADSRCG